MNAILSYMKRNYKVLIIVTVLAVALWSFIPKQEKAYDPEKDRILIELITFVVEKGHYSPEEIDDEFSKGVYKNYLESIDPSKRFFIQSDIEEFSKYETRLDDMIKSKDLTFFDLTHNRLKARMSEAKGFYEEILEKPFDFTADEQFSVDYDKQPYPANDNALRKRWEKQLKLSVLSSVVDKQKLQENPPADKGDKKADTKKPDDVKKTFAELEKEARESNLKSLNDYFDFIEDLKREEWFTMYLNAIAERFDPHTFYLAPNDKEKFDTSMRGSLEGIGARLLKKSDYIEISELIPGGPAWRGKELEPGDLIMKVAQGDEDPIDIAGMRIDDVVKKIKGPKGTEVRLTVKKVDGTIDVISIIREVVEIEETYAKSSIVKKDGKLYGIINLPKFYIDFENKDNRDAAKDVAVEVARLKEEGVEGIIMDLRNNGGGSLRTVVDITGLFIEKGPVVQVRSRSNDGSPNGRVEVLRDNDATVQWDGPLVVLVNNFSASASEIFAAAIQDYNRGIIMGSRHTYGKGTVQNIIDLNQFVRSSSMGDLGALKTTTQKFYRINGGSTQREGVYSDIVMPDRFSYIDMGERDMDYAMPWDKIAKADYRTANNNFSTIVSESKKRMASNPQFQLVDENAKWINEQKDDNTYSLEIDKFKAELTKNEAITKKFKALNDYKNNLKFEALKHDKKIFEKDPSFAEKKERWYESLSKDIYVEEAINVLDDMQVESPRKSEGIAKTTKTIKTR
ncbi:carboxy terminal-processing peptidase [Flavobacterium litorale]|uniref:Carboxy terminal-processing peptidase n=1 Tax=Flavobacterium litorale TaxID=2856519 RepID=A0ABX8VA70_9FLAO|nr:carboxy terminal-processing peptidase [Flavobacterium litorale]QYJ69422.1 carboxy terminal-processing peptidase [Flavobacterium litorale]